MTPPSNLDLQGSFQTHFFADIATEINQAKLSGSLRASEDGRKFIVYFTGGTVVFAVSNQRKHQLAAVASEMTGADVMPAGEQPKYSNDLQLVEYLKKNQIVSEAKIEELRTGQVESIIFDLLDWRSGDWLFSPLAKLRMNINVQIQQFEIFAEHARGLDANVAAGRFRNLKEVFHQLPDAVSQLELEPQEAFVFSRLDRPITAADVVSTCGMPEKDLLKTLYILWVGGLIDRKDWNPAFSDFKIGQIKSANLVLKTHAAATKTVQPKPISVPAAEPPPPEKIPEIEISLEDYLARIESAASLYDVLGLQPDAPLPAIRKAYFALAKMFHPDRFHRGDADVLRRVETAFTKLAQAHETLRNLETRRAYDTKLRREKAEDQMRQSSSAAGQTATKNINADRADQEFEHGRKLLMEDDYESALPFLARAVHFGPLVARYHAFYGKALSQEDTHRHKAENAMQQAIRLEPDNASFRMMLAEFFVKVKLVKRAEGELTRLLTMAPDHREARTLLDSLRQK